MTLNSYRIVSTDAPVLDGENRHPCLSEWKLRKAALRIAVAPPESPVALLPCLDTLHPHGFRSSFRVWAEEQSRASWAAIELSLAHNVGSDTERAYFRSDLLDQRRELMQGWSDYVMGDELP